jgi:hypothetical protein
LPGKAALFLLVENVDEIRRHSFLGDDDFFSSLDNEVTTLVELAFFDVDSFGVGFVMEGTVI